MRHELITTDEQLKALCRSLADTPTICFDTEFISENSYRPQLCLVQIAAGQRLAVIDPLAVGDLTPFWELLAASGHETIVHAGREEFNFCLRAIGRRPANLVDIQIAAGLVGPEYPAAYGTLISKLLGKKLAKHETRTDWSRRPLSPRQIEYALDDVVYLQPMRDVIFQRLALRDRTQWLADEMDAWQDDVQSALAAERWQRVSGVSGFDARALAVVRELWRWREKEAERRDVPVRRVLRDDLICELARRRSADPQQIKAIRGFERRDLQRVIPQLAHAIQKALLLPEDELPRFSRRESPSQINLVAQLMMPILTSICRAADVATGVVGTVQDVRDLVGHHVGLERCEQTPLLMQGWRATVVGQVIEDLLDGKTCIRITDPLSEAPLAIE